MGWAVGAWRGGEGGGGEVEREEDDLRRGGHLADLLAGALTADVSQEAGVARGNGALDSVEAAAAGQLLDYQSHLRQG